MYQIVLRGYYEGDNWIDYKSNYLILHDSRHNDLRLIDPKLDLEINKTGSLVFTITPAHRYFDKLVKLKSEISVYQDGNWLFTGRILNDETNIYNHKKIECEGVLAYLLDSMQEVSVMQETTAYGYLNTLIMNHNNQMLEEHKKFNVNSNDIINVGFTTPIVIMYEDTLNNLNSVLVDNYENTYLSVYVDNNYNKYIRYTNYDNLSFNNQIITFGYNLLSMTRYTKGEDIATAIMPLGAKNGSINIDSENSVDTKLTINELPNTNETIGNYNMIKYGKIVYEANAVEKYGLIIKSVDFGECSDATELLKLAKEQLKYYCESAFTIEVNAFDLNLLNPNIEAIRVGQIIKLNSKPHNINLDLIVEKMSININSAEKSTITLGTKERSAISNTSISKKNSDSTKSIAKLETGSYSYGGGGSYGDLSRYATKDEVDSAFSELASLLGGL